MTDIENPIVVTEYDVRWTEEFLKIQRYINTLLMNKIVKIHHIGSTSVSGLLAKPILDIDIEISDYSVFSEVRNILEANGYKHKGNQGVEDREAFEYLLNRSFMKHHLYVCPSYSKELKRHIIFRDCLRCRADYRTEYEELKRKLSIQYKNNREKYTESKTELIHTILNDIDSNLVN